MQWVLNFGFLARFYLGVLAIEALAICSVTAVELLILECVLTIEAVAAAAAAVGAGG